MRTASIDRPNNRIGVQRSGFDIPRRDPARDAVSLERLD
jgi:hypothetical protein